VNRVGDGEGTVCTYHPGLPLFHEGSKVIGVLVTQAYIPKSLKQRLRAGLFVLQAPCSGVRRISQDTWL
jgi:hypothetical protein